MSRSIQQRVAHLCPNALREMADKIMEETAHRGVLTRFSAALTARSLRELADEKDARQ